MQILLDRELKKRAEERASALGVSLAEYFRRLVRRDLGEPARARDPSVVFCLGDSAGRPPGRSDIARDKDLLVGEAVAAARSRQVAETQAPLTQAPLTQAPLTKAPLTEASET